MELIVSNIHISNVLSPIVVTIHQPTNVQTEGSSSSTYNKPHSIDTSIYRMLSMQSDMKELVAPTKVSTEFDLFLITGQAKSNNIEYNTSFDILDEYLGKLGV